MKHNLTKTKRKKIGNTRSCRFGRSRCGVNYILCLNTSAPLVPHIYCTSIRGSPRCFKFLDDADEIGMEEEEERRKKGMGSVGEEYKRDEVEEIRLRERC